MLNTNMNVLTKNFKYVDVLDKEKALVFDNDQMAIFCNGQIY